MTQDTTPPTPVSPVVVAEPLLLAEADMAAYSATRNGAAYFTLPPAHISKFSGAGAAGALNGLITNDVTKVEVGRGLYAAALTPKGKLLADLSLLRTEPETFLVLASATAGAEWFAMVRKYVNPRLAAYANESDSFAQIGVYGPRAAEILARAGGAAGGGAMVTDALTDALRAWGDWTHALWKISAPQSATHQSVNNPTDGAIEARLVRAPYLGATNGFVLLVKPAAVDTLIARLNALGAISGNANSWNVAALESGRPVFGLDMDATSLPQEANLDDWSAISFEKGCYTGQETVARIHFRGHVNKHLRGVRSAVVLPIGTVLLDENGKSVGEVRRSGLSPTSGAIAIGMIRREVVDGAVLMANVNESKVPGHVFSLTAESNTALHNG